MRGKRPRAELTQLLSEQRQALAASCEGYDKGHEWEAPRLATIVFTLVHDGGSIRSLLTQLGLRSSLRFVSSGSYDYNLSPGTVAWQSPPLVGYRGGSNGMRCVPLFLVGTDIHRAKNIQFESWWAKEAIYRERASGSHLELNRRRLVFALRHQDGGGHIGELTDEMYVRLKAGAGVAGSAADGSMRALVETAAASMRQVAWEVTETLKQLGEVK